VRYSFQYVRLWKRIWCIKRAIVAILQYSKLSIWPVYVLRPTGVGDKNRLWNDHSKLKAGYCTHIFMPIHAAVALFVRFLKFGNRKSLKLWKYCFILWYAVPPRRKIIRKICAASVDSCRNICTWCGDTCSVTTWPAASATCAGADTRPVACRLHRFVLYRLQRVPKMCQPLTLDDLTLCFGLLQIPSQ